MESFSNRCKSETWQYFTKKDDFIATCNLCNNDYSYKASVSNLWKHYLRKHKPNKCSDANETSNCETSDDEQEDSLVEGKGKPTWKYFEVLDSDKFEANCKICGNTVPYKTMSDLKTHITEHGEKAKDSEDEEDQTQLSTSLLKKAHRTRSRMWKYFKKFDSVNRLATCLLCQRIMSYATTLSNLKRHLLRKHPLVKFDSTDDGMKKIIISANGQIYEIESSIPHQKVEAEEEKNPIDMDTVYLEDFDESLEQLPKDDRRSHTSTPKITGTYSTKRHFQTKILKEQFRPEKVRRNRNSDTSSEEDVPNKKRFTKTKMDSVDYFGQYMVSLLKELPKAVSDQLQGEIIKQIISTKVALQSQSTNNYAITVSENSLNQSNQVICEPVTVTVGECNVGDANNDVMMPESTENNELN